MQATTVSTCRWRPTRIYPWGNELPDDRTENLKSNPPCNPKVDSYPDGTSYYGVRNMVGNVQEWTNSPGDDGLPSRVVRGGSFDDNDAQMHCISYGWLFPDLDQRSNKDANERDQRITGFRGVISDPWPAGILK